MKIFRALIVSLFLSTSGSFAFEEPHLDEFNPTRPLSPHTVEMVLSGLAAPPDSAPSLLLYLPPINDNQLSPPRQSFSQNLPKRGRKRNRAPSLPSSFFYKGRKYTLMEDHYKNLMKILNDYDMGAIQTILSGRRKLK